jgi:hypothetical protein
MDRRLLGWIAWSTFRAEAEREERARAVRRKIQREIESARRSEAAYQKLLDQRLRESRIPSTWHPAPRMTAEQYAEAQRIRQSDREAAGVVRRIGQPARLLHDPEASAAWYLSPQYLQEGLNDGKARVPKLAADYRREQDELEAMRVRFMARLRHGH